MMEYFWLKQDKRYTGAPFFENPDKRRWRWETQPQNAYRLERNTVVYAPSEKALDEVNILDTQLFLVSKAVRDVFQLYQKGLSFKQFTILNNTLGEYLFYYAPILSERFCASPKSEWSVGGSQLHRLVLEKDSLKNCAVCKVGGLPAETVVIRLDVAESLLRRKLKGFSLTRLEVV